MATPTVVAARSTVSDFVELTKPRITLMVTFTTAVGFLMASPASPALVATLLGTALVAAGAMTLNMWLERGVDARMLRTRDRPLPAGRLQPSDAVWFGGALTAAGLFVLALLAGRLAALVAGLTWASYLFAYTPLKARTSLSTVVGAFPGALPPVIGWAAARGALEPGAYILFAIMFLWQIPHFLAIAWLYRDDYARGGLPMLPVLDRDGHITGRQVVANSLGLLFVSLTPSLAGMTGRAYLYGAALLGVAFTATALMAAVKRTLPAARTLFLASLVYLAALFLLLFAGRA